jgi:predicted phage terminase large subunit-like protein
MGDLLHAIADEIDPPSDPLREEAQEVAGTLAKFVRHAWPVLEPAAPYMHNWHIDLICEHLEAFYAGDQTRLLFNLPPRYMKSSLVTIFGPAWDWIVRPHHRFIFTSYAASLSTKHSVDRRTLIESDWFQARFGDRFRLASDQNVKTEFSNDKRGHMTATSMMGTATGRGADFVVVDDPQDPKKAASDVQRERINTLFDQTFSQRLDDKRRGGIVVVMQRLHEKDLTGHLLDKTDDQWTHVKLENPALRPKTIVFPQSKKTLERNRGDILWPEREGEEEIAKARIALGSQGFAGQYGQEPAPTEGGLFKRKWWKFWRPAGIELPPVHIDLGEAGVHTPEVIEIPPAFDQRLQSWDCAFKDTKASDYVVGQVWAAHGARRFLLDQIRDRMSFTETLDSMRMMAEQHPEAYAKLVEDKANGSAVIDTLKAELIGLIPVEPQGGKEARASAVSPQVEAGQVFLPHPAIAPWVFDFIEEHAVFPNGAFDDQVDGTTQALLRLARTQRESVTVPRRSVNKPGVTDRVAR